MALFALVLSTAQVLSVSHDVHDLESPGERASCTICVLGHGVDAALVPASGFPMSAAVDWFDRPRSSITCDDQLITRYRARGPPCLPATSS